MSPRSKAAALLLLLVPLGFGAKFYLGPGRELLNNSLAGSLYVVFWCVALFWVRPSLRPWINVAWVLGVTSVLECLQLWSLPLLKATRDTFVGRAFLGTTFSASDFAYYVLGAAAALLLLKRLRQEIVQQVAADSP
tara:strand:- start:217 stop:624 length:408 start_codon:yes stop_codon:yes gene_type:complete